MDWTTAMVSEPRYPALHSRFPLPPPRPNHKLSRANPLPLLLPKPNPRDPPPQLQPRPQKHLEWLRISELRNDEDDCPLSREVFDRLREGNREGRVVDTIAREDDIPLVVLSPPPLSPIPTLREPIQLANILCSTGDAVLADVLEDEREGRELV